MKKTATIFLAIFILQFSLFSLPTAFAADTLLPQGAETLDENADLSNDTECMNLIEEINSYSTVKECDTEGKNCQSERDKAMADKEKRELFLSCGIKTGNIHLWMMPFYLTFIIEFLIGLVGLVSVLFVIIGGYFFAWGGLTEDKEKGKKTIIYALVGLALASLSWILVNIIQTQLTS